jgi:hypothetical protein
MSPKISALIRKNSDEVISTRSVQIDRCYCQYNNEGADEIILSFFPTYLCYGELLWQHFPPVLLKLQEEVARKFSGLEDHSRTLHHTLHNIVYSLFENKCAIFTKC